MTFAGGSLSTQELSDDIRLQQERETAIREERTRLARDIHDTLAQAFVGIAIQLEAAEEVLFTDHDLAAVHVNKARRLALDSIAEARRTIAALRPPALDNSDLPTALGNAVQQVMEGTSLRATFEVDGDRITLPSALETELLRVAQEALTNVVKHASATSVEVRLTFAPEELQLCVEDNGTGFHLGGILPSGTNTNGHTSSYGIIGMRERIERLRGHIEFISGPAQGTCVRVSVPLPTPQQSRFSPEQKSLQTAQTACALRCSSVSEVSDPDLSIRWSAVPDTESLLSPLSISSSGSSSELPSENLSPQNSLRLPNELSNHISPIPDPTAEYFADHQSEHTSRGREK